MIRKWFIPICIGLLMIVLTVIGFMSFLGYKIIEANAVYILFGLLIGLALGKLAFWITGKIRRKGLRMLIGLVCTLVVSAILMLMLTFFSFVSNFYTPHQYTRLKSESGREVVVLRQLSQQFAYDRAADKPDSELQYEDLGYQYQIYPVFSKFFYNSKQPAEGSLEIGCASEAVLMHQWDGETLHMYIDHPAEFDTGELFFH